MKSSRRKRPDSFRPCDRHIYTKPTVHFVESSSVFLNRRLDSGFREFVNGTRKPFSLKSTDVQTYFVVHLCFQIPWRETACILVCFPFVLLSRSGRTTAWRAGCQLRRRLPGKRRKRFRFFSLFDAYGCTRFCFQTICRAGGRRRERGRTRLAVGSAVFINARAFGGRAGARGEGRRERGEDETG